ncbi:MAG: AAA family ATPase [Bacteroidota bacterium]
MTPPRAIPNRIRALLEVLNQDLFEKEKATRLALLAGLAGESIFLLGPPGVAKSMLARRLKLAFEGGQAFEYLMGKFSTPDEVFGPVSISKLKNEDAYERLTQDYLPGAQVVFLDEIWKASPPIQNALLTVLNERVYRNGAQEIQVDLRALIAASNELPAEGEGLEALWDRFLIRLEVGGIHDKSLFNEMLRLPGSHKDRLKMPAGLSITDQEYQKWSREIDYIEVPDHVLELIHSIRKEISAYNQDNPSDEHLYVSDRRWRKVVRLLRTAAFLNGRRAVDVMDCLLMGDCLWDTTRQIPWVRQVVEDAVKMRSYRYLVDLSPIDTALKGLQQDIKRHTEKVEVVTVQKKLLEQDEKGQVYVRIPNFWGNDAAYVRQEDFDQLTEKKEVFVPTFEKAPQGFRPFQSYSFLLSTPVEVLNKKRKFVIAHEEVEEERISPQVPAPEKIDQWDTRIGKLLDACQVSLQRLEHQIQQDQQYVHTHLFVDATMSSWVEAGWQEAYDAILRQRIRIEKVQHDYQGEPSV